MLVKELNLLNFRNYKEQKIEFCEGVNLIYGDNGQGKTNIAEAIFMFCSAKSHRTPREREMILLEEEYSKIKLDFCDRQRNHTAEITLERDKPHKIKINGVENIKNAELIGKFLAVMFSPEDFCFIKEGPSERRKFLDIAISQLKPAYFKKLSEYNRYLKSKILALKEPSYHDMIDLYNQRLAEIASDIMEYRHNFIEILKPKIEKLNKEITKKGEILRIEYQSVVPYTENKEKRVKEIYKKLQKVKQRELIEKISLAGTHRDDLDFYLNDLKLKDFGSQGQVRTAVLAIKLAQAEILRESYGEEPVLILDDILSELDAGRRRFLLSEIRGKQVIITGTDKANFGKRKDTKLLYIKNGHLIENEKGE